MLDFYSQELYKAVASDVLGALPVGITPCRV